MPQDSPHKPIADHIKSALKHFHEPEWLGKRSPLASAYFLSAHLSLKQGANNSDQIRGRVLQDLLRQAAQNMWPGELPTTFQGLKAHFSDDSSDKRFEFYLLELYYLRDLLPSRTHPPQDNKQELAAYLSMSQATLFRWIARARDSLMLELLKLVRPTTLYEKPQEPAVLIGRENMIDKIIQSLEQSQAVMLSGMGGVGKTTLGSAVYTRWVESAPAVWITIRPQLNDHFNSILFALASFLKQHGSVSLWSQLLLNLDKPQDKSILLGCLKRDLESITPSPLLCFDEVDRLATLYAAVPNPNHTAILELLELLVSLSPLLLMGQRAVIDTPQHLVLNGLSSIEADQLLDRLTPAIDKDTISRWHQWTSGNPRLLHLCAILHHNGEALRAEVLDLSGPFQRLWRRLSPQEQLVLGELAVYRDVAPRNAWLEQKAVLEGLMDRQLVLQAGMDEIYMLPTWQQFLYEQVLFPEVREAAHAKAYAVLLQNGEFTRAVYHSVKAGNLTEAIDLWVQYRDLEIERGFSAAAREIFMQISPNQVAQTHREKLIVIRNQFFEAAGELKAILATSLPRPDIDETTIETLEIDEQTAKASYRLTGSDEAFSLYETALMRLIQLMSRAAKVHNQRGQMMLEFRQLDAARQEIDSIYLIYRRLEAEFARRTGKLQEAEEIIVDLIDSDRMISDTQRTHLHRKLAAIYSQLGKWEDATQHAQQAEGFYDTIGNRVFQEMMRMELAGIQMQAGNYAEAIEYGKRALTFFEEINNVAVMPFILNYLAESHLGLGNLAEAETFAYRAYQQESHGEFPNTCYTLGLIHKKRGQSQQALEVFSRGLSVAETNQDRFLQAYLLRERGKVYANLQEKLKAQADKEGSTKLFTQMGMLHEIET